MQIRPIWPWIIVGHLSPPDVPRVGSGGLVAEQIGRHVAVARRD
jgi:hypothetical protein